MGTQIEDEELRAYADRIGHTEYRKTYHKLYVSANKYRTLRYSREKNKTIDLKKIKEKYKNGVTKDILNEMFDF